MSVVLLVITVACIVAAYRQHIPLLDSRAQYRLTSAEPLENAPPLVAFTTVALGGFRGIIADLLWLRADQLQDEGKYFELVQLADWITKLEPRFTDVWAFHAWNMAYNVSVMFPDPEDRWRWVRHGIELIRDEGIFYNPGDALLYKELGWLFQDKIGGTTDDVHMYYKRKWAEEMMSLLGGAHPDYEHLDQKPELVAHMREKYKLLPDVMREVDDRYGPLDWRMPDAHAIYWAYRGLKYASPKDKLFCDRMILQGLSRVFVQGRLVMRPETELFIAGPYIDLLPKILKAYDKAHREYGDVTVDTAYANFLKKAVVVLYTSNRKETAIEMFRRLNERFPSKETANGFEACVFYVFARTTENISPEEAVAMAEDSYFKSLFWCALGDNEQSAGYDSLSRLLWAEYTRLNTKRTRERVALPPIEELQKKAQKRALAELQEPLRSRLRAMLDGAERKGDGKAGVQNDE